MWPVLMHLAIIVSFSWLSCCSFDDCKLTTEWLLSRTRHRPKIAIVCGSGLGLLADNVSNKQTFRYEDIPNFPVSTGTGFMEAYQSWTEGRVYTNCFSLSLSRKKQTTETCFCNKTLFGICSNKAKDRVCGCSFVNLHSVVISVSTLSL